MSMLRPGSLLVLVGTLVVLSFMLVPGALAQPSISWEPNKLSLELAQNDEIIVDVTVSSRRAASSAEIWIPPSFRDAIVPDIEFIDLEPNVGQVVQLRIIGEAFASSDMMYEGTIHLRQDKGTLARPLPFVIYVSEPKELKRVEDSTGKFSVSVPDEWIVFQANESLNFYFDEERTNIGAPPNLYADVFDMTEEFLQQESASEVSMSALLKSGVDPDFIISEQETENGFRYEVAEYGRFRHVLTDTSTSKAVVFVCGDAEIFDSIEFDSVLQSLSFQD